MQTQERVVSSEGQDYQGGDQHDADDVGPGHRRGNPAELDAGVVGQTPGRRIIGLAAGIVFIFLGFDFIFRAAGAADVGFGAFVYSIGGALAAPFAGIFKTASTTSGTVIVWADILAAVVYAIAATVLVKVVSMSTDQRARRSI